MKHVEAKETVGTGIPSMKKFIGTKEVLARPMTRKDYNSYRGWELPSDEDGNDLGQLVEYLNSPSVNHPNHKGYISWSPSNEFFAAYNANGNHNFGDAIMALKQGKRVCRDGWNGKGLFIFIQVPSSVPATIIPKMTSLPSSVKDEFKRREIASSSTNTKEHLSIRYENQIAIVKPNNEINGWSPSTADALAEDWIILY